MNIKPYLITTLFALSYDGFSSPAEQFKSPIGKTPSSPYKTKVIDDSIDQEQGKFLWNRNWQFKWGNRLSTDKDQKIHLPHSFSLPYFLSDAFYTGKGTYTKTLELPNNFPPSKQIFLDVEAAFQVADIYVNGKKAGSHEGGYTGFQINLTPYLKTGKNIIEIEVDNRWNPQIAPRAGEHVFSGGLYRDVYLNITDAAHIPLYGIWVKPHIIQSKKATISVATEIANNAATTKNYIIKQMVMSQKTGKTISSITTTCEIPAKTLKTIESKEFSIPSPKLWSPNTPNLYVLRTTITTPDGKLMDKTDTPFGLRNLSISKDYGVKLNGDHLYLRGANVHQDRAGWGDAATNQAFYRDVNMIKQTGMNFIRGSHYPHDPAFVEACDNLGMGYMCEGIFWGMGGEKEHDQFWNCDAYPRQESDRAPFEASCTRQVKEMVKAFRNNPSILMWSISNEPFFTHNKEEAKQLCEKLIALVKELDPTRPVCAGGGQRGGFAELGDFGAYNGDGANFIKPERASMVSEYGSVSCKRPGEYAPGWGDLNKSKQEGITYPWRMGEIIWCGFDHGSIWSAGARMGIVDYFRIPKRSWYWYKNEFAKEAPPAWPKQGTATNIALVSDNTVINSCNGQDDVHIMAQLVDHNGHAINTEAPITFEIISGPGEFPTGKSITFSPNTDIDMRDGSAAIEMRSYYSGKTKIKASSPNVQDAFLEIETKGDRPYDRKVSNETINRPYKRFTQEDKKAQTQENEQSVANLAKNRPCRTSTNMEDRFLANDGDAQTIWKPTQDDKKPSWELDMEFDFPISKIQLVGAKGISSKMIVSTSMDRKKWHRLTPKPVSFDQQSHSCEITTPDSKPIRAKYIRIDFENATDAGLSEITVNN